MCCTIFQGQWILVSTKGGQRGSVGWLYRLRLGRQCGRMKERFQMLFQFGLDSSVVVQSEAEVRCTEYCKGQVHGSQFGQLRGLVASQVAGESIWSGA